MKKHEQQTETKEKAQRVGLWERSSNGEINK